MELTQEQRDILIDWINRYIIPTKNVTNVDTADIRKAFIETYAYGFYLDNYTLNDVMLGLGYHASNFRNEPYLHYNVSRRSPALLEYRRYLSEHSAYEKYE